MVSKVIPMAEVPMTRDKAEQQARAWLEKRGLYSTLDNNTAEEIADAASLTQLLLDTQAACLEEAAQIAEREDCQTDDPLNHACRITQRLREQAAQRRTG
jgi:flagellin-specific chaperone FliS